MHYARFTRHGDITKGWPSTPEEGFWMKVNKTEGCWFWEGSTNNQGYGAFAIEGKRYYAHRLAYVWLRGGIPDGMVIDHLCRVRNCVNPNHLEVVDFRENVLRGVGPTAVNASRTHCKRGHELAGDNLYIRPNGYRNCKSCRSIYQVAK